MKHAYLILAHHQWELIELLLRCLDHPQHTFYIHIDKKAGNIDETRFRKLLRQSSVTFVDRVDVRWGGFSQIQAELTLLKAALPGHFDYYHLLSGVDLPLRSAEKLVEFFDQHNGAEFVHFCTPPFSAGDSVQERVKYYYPLQETVGRSHGVWHKLSKAFVTVQRLMGVDRRKTYGKPIVCGANWFSITHELATYVLAQESTIKGLCKNGFCVDEIFLQTLVWNSPFREKVYCLNEEGDYHSCLRFVDWERGNPYTFTSEDFDELTQADYLFARKFDWEHDSSICRRLAEYTLNGT